MNAANLKMGDLCEFKTDDTTTVAYGIAWQAADKARSTTTTPRPAATSDIFRSAFSLREGSRVTVSKILVEQSHVTKVVLKDCTKREGAQEINDDRRWRLRAAYQLGEFICQMNVFSAH
jgi:hypothetical protein